MRYPKKNHNYKLFVGLFFILGGLLRSWNFWTQTFSGDEAAQMRKAVSVARGIADLVLWKNPLLAFQNIFITILQHNHPPLEFLLLLPAVPFHPREFFARSIYVFINIIFLPISYWALFRLKLNRVGLFFLLLLSTSMYAIWSSQVMTRDSLVIMEGAAIGISMLYFLKKPGKFTLYFLFLMCSIALLTSPDMVLYALVSLILVWKKRSVIGFKNIFFSSVVPILIASLFYIPYILYAFSPGSPRVAGANYYFNGKLTSPSNNPLSLKTYHDAFFTFTTNFFSLSGVFPACIFALFSLLLIRKKKFILPFFIIIFLFLGINVFKITSAYFYMNFYGLMLLLSATWLGSTGRIGVFFLFVTVFINLMGGIPLLEGKHNPMLFSGLPKKDNIIASGTIAKKCLQRDESYISTDDPWRTFYYFGRPMLPSVEGGLWKATEATEAYLKGDLRNEVKLIHFRKGQFDQTLIDQLDRIKKQSFTFGDDFVYLFKTCS